MLPVIEAHDVDLVLSGHDHVYSRGYLDDNETDEPDVIDGPVFVVSNSGPKYYELAPEDDKVWVNNGATQVTRHQHISFIHGLRVDGDTLSYEAVVAQKGDGASSDLEVGETIETFTITKDEDGSKLVTEDIKERVAVGLGTE